jgi:hypothetical protein
MAEQPYRSVDGNAKTYEGREAKQARTSQKRQRPAEAGRCQ